MPQASSFIKKRLWHSCFPVNFEKFLRTPFFIEHLRWLPLPVALNGLMQGMSQRFYFDGYSIYTDNNPVNICLFKVNNKSTRKKGEICSKLTRKVPEQCHWRLSGVSIVNVEHSFRDWNNDRRSLKKTVSI